MPAPIQYQPNLLKNELEYLKAGNFDLVKGSIESTQSGCYLRRSIDRLQLIVDRIQDQLTHLSVIDLGCANGFFVNALSYLGALKAIGIDNNTHNTTFNLNISSCLEMAKMQAQELGVDTHFFDFDIGLLTQKNILSLSLMFCFS